MKRPLTVKRFNQVHRLLNRVKVRKYVMVGKKKKRKKRLPQCQIAKAISQKILVSNRVKTSKVEMSSYPVGPGPHRDPPKTKWRILDWTGNGRGNEKNFSPLAKRGQGWGMYSLSPTLAHLDEYNIYIYTLLYLYI